MLGTFGTPSFFIQFHPNKCIQILVGCWHLWWMQRFLKNFGLLILIRIDPHWSALHTNIYQFSIRIFESNGSNPAAHFVGRSSVGRTCNANARVKSLGLGIFFDFCFLASLLFSFSLLFCFYSSLLLCFFRFSASLLLRFFASLLCCLFASFSLFFPAFPASLLLCFLPFPAFLLTCFSAFPSCWKFSHTADICR